MHGRRFRRDRERHADVMPEGPPPPNLVGLRPIRSRADDNNVGWLFERTLGLGRPLPFRLPGLEHYRELSLGWYLGPGRDDVAVVEFCGRFVGYVLVCVDEPDHQRWLRRRGPGLAVRMEVAALRTRGEAGRAGRRFYADRLSEMRELRHAGGGPMPVHAHLNLDAIARNGTAALQALAHVDSCSRRVGAPGWYGEINTIEDRRAAALERLGLEVVHRSANRTMTRALGQPVARLTVVRRVATSNVVPTTTPASTQPARLQTSQAGRPPSRLDQRGPRRIARSVRRSVWSSDVWPTPGSSTT